MRKDASPPQREGITRIKNVDFNIISSIIFAMYTYTKELKNFARVNRKAGNLSEALLWNELKQRKMGVQFKRQRPIGAYIADFYCEEINMVIEIDGWSHDNKYEYDQERDEYMKSLGIFVLRISDIDVKRDMNNVLIWIKHNIDNR
ncbi:MAG: endonuclease domain-containing protein [Alphaproteobacteria bacterium]